MGQNEPTLLETGPETTRLRKLNEELQGEVERLNHELARRDEWADGVSAVAARPPWRAA